MSRKPPRELSAEEKALWRKVAERTTPLRPFTSDTKALPVEPPAATKLRPREPLPMFRIGEKPASLAATTPAAADDAVRMDRKTHVNLKRGKLKPQARLDLHGLTLDQAHPRLVRFIHDAHASGKRLVLVITGKGKDRDEGGPIPVRRGILKHHVPQWLASPALSFAVLQVTEAHVRHGGSGAYYVYLRRKR